MELIFPLIFCSLVMSLAWLVQRRQNNAGWVDVTWAALIGALALYYAISAGGHPAMRTLAGLMGLAWAGRLAWHLAVRVAGEDEDGRYRALREHWSRHTQLKFFLFFQAQALLAWLFGLVFFALSSAEQGPAPWPLIAAMAVWLLALAGEAVADRQLARCRSRQPGVTCREGLWAWSRHPNYFFEWLGWFSYPLLAWGQPQFWPLLLAPVLMLLFLYRLTGIPWTEQQALRSRGEDYRRYQEQVSAFVPWPPKG